MRIPPACVDAPAHGNNVNHKRLAFPVWNERLLMPYDRSLAPDQFLMDRHLVSILLRFTPGPSGDSTSPHLNPTLSLDMAQQSTPFHLRKATST